MVSFTTTDPSLCLSLSLTTCLCLFGSQTYLISLAHIHTHTSYHTLPNTHSNYLFPSLSHSFFLSYTHTHNSSTYTLSLSFFLSFFLSIQATRNYILSSFSHSNSFSLSYTLTQILLQSIQYLFHSQCSNLSHILFLALSPKLNIILSDILDCSYGFLAAATHVRQTFVYFSLPPFYLFFKSAIPGPDF